MQHVKTSGLNQGGNDQEIYHAKNANPLAEIYWYSWKPVQFLMTSWIDFANNSKALGPTTDKEAYQTANMYIYI